MTAYWCSLIQPARVASRICHGLRGESHPGQAPGKILIGKKRNALILKEGE